MRIGKLLGLLVTLAMSQACDDGSTDPVPTPTDQGVDALPDAEVDPDAQIPDAGQLEDEGVDAEPAPRCGDGTQDPGEACDDGNLEPNDGCDNCAWGPAHVTEPDRRGAPLDLHFNADGLAEGIFSLERDDDEDWFRLSLTEPMDLAIVIDAADPAEPCPGDPEIALFLGDEAAFALVDDSAERLCPQLGAIEYAALSAIGPATLYIRVRAANQTATDGFALRIWRRAGIAPEARCDSSGFLGRCEQGTRCARLSIEDETGQCVAPGCGDWMRDAGEACDSDEGHCAADCALLGEMEVEPNDTIETASAVGPGVADFGDWAATTILSALDDIDHLRFTVPDDSSDVAIGIYDGFFDCPGGLRASVLDAEGTFVMRTEDACGIRTLELLPQGDYVLRLTADGIGATNVPIFVFLDLRPRVHVGEACDDAQRCAPGGWCVDAQCVADICGDGQQGADEACDDGNLESDDGCDSRCAREVIQVEPPGAELRFDLAANQTLRYRFGLPEGGVLHAITSGVQVCPGDTRLMLTEQPSGEILALNDDGDNTICSELVYSLPPGDYELQLESSDQQPIFGGLISIRFDPVSAVGALCDDAAPPCVANAWCTPEQLCAAIVCGDGEQAPTEQCDDGNLLNGDGCDETCVLESTDVTNGADLERPGLSNEEADFYAFEIGESMRLQAWTDNNRGRCSADSYMQLERFEADEWTPIAEDDDGGLTICSRLDRPVPPGRYELVVTGAEGGLEPYWMHVRLLPQIADGEACVRSGEVNACMQDRWCLPTDVEGTGTCAPLVPFVDEIEPDQHRDTAQRIPANTAVRAHLDAEFVSDDFVDLFVVNLPEAGLLRAQTGDGEDGCPGDTILFRIDPDHLALGVEAAILSAYAVSDDTENLRCSALEEDLPAGEHWYVVHEYNREAPLDYVFRARTVDVQPANARCDAHGQLDRCAAELVCQDPDGDGDGRCGAEAG